MTAPWERRRPPEEPTCRFSTQRRVREVVVAILVHETVTEADAHVVADAIVRTELRGVHTHGLWFLPVYVSALRTGVIRARARPNVVNETPATAVVDADGSFGHVAMQFAADVAATKAVALGTATVLVKNSNHFGAAGYFALRLAESGLVSMLGSNGPPIMTVPGARGRVICNQPIAYGIPGVDGSDPIVFDIALSTVAGAKVAQADARGTDLQPGCLVTADGTATSDPGELFAGGALTPLGGHKGYGLALLVELLAGALSGAGMTSQVSSLTGNAPTRTGHWLTVLAPGAFLEADDFASRVAWLRHHLQHATANDGVEPVRLPGERASAHEAESLAGGLDVDDEIWVAIERLANEAGAGQLLEARIG